MKLIHLFSLFLGCCCSISAQVRLHSHNDYEQSRPFYLAYEHKFASIEADIFLVNGELYVAHDKEKIDSTRTFKALYLNPIVELMQKQNNKIYSDGTPLQLLIDLKTDHQSTLPVLEKQLLEHKACFDSNNNSGAVKVVISGSIPPADLFDKYDSIIFFDGRPQRSYTPKQQERLGMISDSYSNHAKWPGYGAISETDKQNIETFVSNAHQMNIPARLWGCPDNEAAWDQFITLNFDFINTDKIQQLRQYIDTKK